MQLFIAAIFVSSFKEFALLAGGVLSGKTILFGKESYDVWRTEMVSMRLAFRVHCVSMVSVVNNSASLKELLTW